LQEFRPIVKRARDRELTEEDTKIRITRFVENVLGYDPYKDISAEYQVRGSFVDYAIRAKGQIQYFVEVKSVKTKLNERHLAQIITYVANAGVEFCVLTNLVEWHVYHIEFGKPVTWTLLFSVNLIEQRTAKVAELIWVLSRKAVISGELEALWKKTSSIAPANLLQAVFSAEGMNGIRKALKKASGHKFTLGEVARAVADLLDKPSLMDGRVAKMVKKLESADKKPRPARKTRKTTGGAQSPTGNPESPGPS
jgi:predicted type IV restriction endonuclease